MFGRLRQFLREVRLEFNKVSWPSQAETVALTTLVILMVLALTAVVLSLDTVFVHSIRYVTQTVRL
jgi:preprotein translocase SecE subunit